MPLINSILRYIGILAVVTALCLYASNIDSNLPDTQFLSMLFDQVFYGTLCLALGLGLCWLSEHLGIYRENGKLEYYLGNNE
ncbi:MAG: hypothetical protein WCO55_05925 [Candidatus Falkowbacteria bacterium]